MRDLICATCGKAIPHGHVARYTGVDIEHIQVHHVRCGRAHTKGVVNQAESGFRNVIRNVLARIGLTI